MEIKETGHVHGYEQCKNWKYDTDDRQDALCKFNSLNRNKEHEQPTVKYCSCIPRVEENGMEHLHSFDIGEICVIPATIVEIISSAKVGIHTCLNNLTAVYHFLTNLFFAKAVSKVKQAHTCAPHRHPPPTSMSPNTFRPPTLTFNPSIFPPCPSFISLCNMAAAGGAPLLLPVKGREGKGRSGLHLSFASPYHFSNLAPTTTPPPTHWFAFDIQQWVWSGVRRGEGGTHARQWTPDPLTRWTLAVPPVSSHQLKSNIPCCCFQWHCPLKEKQSPPPPCPQPPVQLSCRWPAKKKN